MNHSRSPWKHAWPLEEDVDFLNHGSFGACPYRVLEAQSQFRRMLESQPLRFLHRELEPWIDRSRRALSTFVGTNPANMVSVTNATEGVNTVLRSLVWKAGQSILVTDHGYNACRNAVHFVAERSGLNVQVATIPRRVATPDVIVDSIMNAVDETTVLALIDHVTSPTALVFPVAELTRRLHERGVMALIDGAHAPGMLPLELDVIGADFYTGNCHKWVCAPKGAGFLVIAPEHHEKIRPLAISHGANSTRTDRSRLHLEFDWTGTTDPTPWLSVADALEFWDSGFQGGFAEAMEANRNMALAARELVARRCGLESTAGQDALVGSMVSFVLPDRPADSEPVGPLRIEALQQQLMDTYRIEVPVFPWPREPSRLLRIACQCYNDLNQIEYLAEAFRRLEPF